MSVKKALWAIALLVAVVLGMGAGCFYARMKTALYEIPCRDILAFPIVIEIDGRNVNIFALGELMATPQGLLYKPGTTPHCYQVPSIPRWIWREQ